jgi:pantetheine-phosphate adenylyltransferase
LFDEVVIAVLVNNSKTGLFTIDERVEMISDATKHLKNVKVDTWSGLLVDYCRAHEIAAIRGFELSAILITSFRWHR